MIEQGRILNERFVQLRWHKSGQSLVNRQRFPQFYNEGQRNINCAHGDKRTKKINYEPVPLPSFKRHQRTTSNDAPNK